MSAPPPTPERPPRFSPAAVSASRGGTLLITNLLKLGGLAVALNEALLRSTLRPVAMAEAAFMMAGAQVSETVMLSLLNRLLSRDPAPEPGP